MGKIVEAIPGKDGLIRTFKLKTKSGLLTRSIQRLHLLESGEERDFPDVATDDAPSCVVPSRRRTIKPPAWQKDYCFKLFLFLLKLYFS